MTGCTCRKDLADLKALEKTKAEVDKAIEDLRRKTFLHGLIGLDKPHPDVEKWGSNIA
jgi:hypothetical protein